MSVKGGMLVRCLRDKHHFDGSKNISIANQDRPIEIRQEEVIDHRRSCDCTKSLVMPALEWVMSSRRVIHLILL